MCTRSVSILVIFTFVSLFKLTFTYYSPDLLITLSNGNKLMGKFDQTMGGRPVKSFTGIPYAKPPIGNLRFKDPKAYGTWQGVHDAGQEGPMCPQRHLFERSYDDWGEEDCLYLNVYAPHSVDGPLTNLPVMVYIHGGGFTCGAGIVRGYGPGHLLDKDVILVAFNYRLGILGFLSTEDENCPGNFGLKDQVLALKWVHANIRHFGGDPQSVTIFGGSAGGASVTYLMASPLARGYFQRAIAHSGTNLAPWSQPANKGFARKQAIKLAEMLHCYKPGDWSQTIDCIRKIPAEVFPTALYQFFEYDFDRMNAFPPVIDSGISDKPFLMKHPNDLLLEQKQKIPFLTGINYDEGLLKTAALFSNPTLLLDLAKNFDYAAPIIFYYDHHNNATQDAVTAKVKDFYFRGGLTKQNLLNLTSLYGDGWFLSAMDLYLRLRLAHNDTAQTYVYLLTNKANYSFSAIFAGDQSIFHGVSHSDEELYLFPDRQIFFTFMRTLPTKEEIQVRNAMVEMWTNFARTGNPNSVSSDLPKWNQVKRFPIDYYRIGNLNFVGKPLFGMENGMFENRSTFWRELGLYSTKKYPSDDELNVFLKNNLLQNSAIKIGSFTWIWLIGCTLYSVFLKKILS